jgi:hypothetical protein
MGKVKYMSNKYLFLQSRQHALQIPAESGSCLVRQMLTRKKTCVYYASVSTNFAQSFHCSESAMCDVLFRETIVYGKVVTKQYGVTTHKPQILSITFVEASNLSSKRVVFNPLTPELKTSAQR